MKIGVVFEGGGGKGAYQIGVWKAMRNFGIDEYVTDVSGTSVGALNAVLFYQGNYQLAEELWKNITDSDILHEKRIDDYYIGDCLFSQKKLGELIDTALCRTKKNNSCRKCYVTCRYRDRNNYRYFTWSDLIDLELKKRVLIASTAIPVLFESINIDGEWYVDGGVNGDNIPVKPLENNGLDIIIVIHLSGNPACKGSFSGQLLEIYPSEDLGGFITGTLDFSNESIHKRMQLGYVDGREKLKELADLCFSQKEIVQRHSASLKKSERTYKTNYKYTEEEEMVDFKFTSEDAKKEYEAKLSVLKNIADNKEIDSAYLWDATVQKLASKMAKVNNILHLEGISDLVTSKMFKDIGTFLERCGNAEFHIALVGTIKAGKSTLINALLGYEYASMNVTPETAALTKFKKGAVNQVKVSFYTDNEWEALWKSANDAKATVFLEEYEKLGADDEKSTWLGQPDKITKCDTKEELVAEIKTWTSSKSKCHYFVKEVEVELQEFDLPDGIVLVDTPGLDDAVEYRSNITRDYIDRANAVLVCVKADALTGSEMATIYSVFSNTRYNPGKVYIIATQIDALNRPRENWIEQQKEWLKYLKGSGAYASLELAQKNLVPVSAYFYTLLKQYNDLAENDDRIWVLQSILMRLRVRDIHERYQEMLDFTNIVLLKNKIQREIVSDYKKLLIDDIVGSYELCKESIKETMAKVRAAQEEIIEVSQGGIEEIKKKQAEYHAKCQEAENDKKELESLLKSLKMATTQRANDLEKAIKNLAQ